MKKVILITVLFLAAALLASGAASGVEITGPEAAPAVIDLDLSGMSGTVVFAQVYNMMTDPVPYLGKIIRIAGYYSAFEDIQRGVVYHACVIPDATACCAQGIEFIWQGEHAWPDDYPEETTDITVTGRLEMYEEDGYNYLHLVDSEVIWDHAKEGEA